MFCDYPNFILRKLRHRKVNSLARDHTVRSRSGESPAQERWREALCWIKGDRANFSTITVNWPQIKPIPSSYCFCKELINHDISWNGGRPAAQRMSESPLRVWSCSALASKTIMPQTCREGNTEGPADACARSWLGSNACPPLGDKALQ